MPIKIPETLPARQTLAQEGVRLIGEDQAKHQDIRPLRIALLNLMPNKKVTEIQLSRLLGASPLQIELTLLNTASYQSRHVEPEHLLSFYKTLDQVADEKFDGLIVTGAPIEQMPYEEVHYWPELVEVFDWSARNVHSTFGICWGAQAMLYHQHKVPKHQLPTKKFGIYRHINDDPSDLLMMGINDHFMVPVSRHTEVRAHDIPTDSGLKILAHSYGSGLCLLANHEDRRYYMFNHLEYDAGDLDAEYKRDMAAGQPIDLPVNYYPDDDPAQMPKNNWRGHAHLLFGNWINLVYQSTPYNLDQVRSAST